MKQCAFTIVAKNYIGLGKILEKSLLKHSPQTDFYIFVADELDEAIHLPDNVLISKPILGYEEQQWTDMSFKYDLTEFCTSIKPSCFQYIFKMGYDKAIYFDPDIYVFSPIDQIYEILENYDVALTPQIAGIHIKYNGEHPEWAMNVNGIFNLGFCAMRQSQTTTTILEWWRQRLLDNSFADRSTGNFTDQKWMDWLPGLLNNDSLYVIHELGMNMAPWNFFERELFLQGNNIMVKYRTADNPHREDQLVFLHFAGYDYQKMKQGIISRKRIEELTEYDDLQLATDCYRQAIMDQQETFDKFIGMQYSYGFFENGQRIAAFHRRLYHGFSVEHQTENFPSPFAAGKGTFYELIKKKGMIDSDNIDSITKRNIPNIDNKRNMIARLFKLLYMGMGYKRYVLFLKSLYFYCRPELHTFLIKK